MPATDVVFYQEDDGAAPARDALRDLLRQGKSEEKSVPKATSSALEILDRMIGDDPELRAMIDEERVNVQVAREIYELRTSRGLTQKDLAGKIGTTQSVIARLEDADYEGHSLRMLRKVARALGARLSVHLVPEEALTP